MDDTIFLSARNIAEKNLQKCYRDGKVLASLINFSDYWARDTFYALSGILILNDLEIAKNSLEFFANLQSESGHIPRKISLDYAGIKYLFKKQVKRKNPQVVHSGLIPSFICVDSNALFVIAFEKYLSETNDLQTVEKYYSNLKKAANWYDNRKKKGLVSEGPLCNWMDTILKTGNVLYTNVVYCQALKSLSAISKKINQEKDSVEFENKFLENKEKINEIFWNGEFFRDEIRNDKNMDMAGNVLLCYFNLTSEDRIKKVIERIEDVKNEKLIPPVFPPYSFWKINPILYPFGIQDYQNKASWLWIDLFFVAAKFKNGSEENAVENFKDICETIVQNNAIYETYYGDGKPFNKKLWKSAVPFAWNAGVFLEVYNQLINP